jgi:hypothetical protein
VDRGAEDVAILEHDRTEMTADADRDRLAFHPELSVRADVVLHATRSVERIVRRRKRRHDLIADRLDDRSMVLLGRGTHDLDAGEDHIASAQIPHDFIDARAADHVGEHNGQFDVLTHTTLVRTHRDVFDADIGYARPCLEEHSSGRLSTFRITRPRLLNDVL